MPRQIRTGASKKSSRTRWITASAGERLSEGVIERHTFAKLAEAGLIRVLHLPIDGSIPRYSEDDIRDLLVRSTSTLTPPKHGASSRKVRRRTSQAG